MYNLLREWCMHWFGDTSRTLRNTFKTFLQSLPEESDEAAELEKIFLKRQKTEKYRMQQSSLSLLFDDTSSSWKPSLNLNEASDCKSVFDLEPHQVADHLSAICFLLYSSMKLKDIASWCFKTSQREIQQCSVHRVKRFTTHLMEWCQRSILTTEDAKGRKERVDFLLKVAENCLNLKNVYATDLLLKAINKTTATSEDMLTAKLDPGVTALLFQFHLI
eukprot:TRINITY_DN1758_c0_g1_i4.p1 TRINITY_DN1758_c0_g1~~TRINITY_DN1758_c0_g1_i4.p1  ORF type:complete len:219 (+),score=37.37 TRINITY_DN1758_c0_g1_i4:351-1007(+)